MDYDLSRLSSRSFEQLAQALAVRHFGPGAVIFGDGPDGGREALVEGKMEFAPHGSPWDGVCVVQAKFRQRPLGTEHDGPWAIEALEQELKKFAARTGGRSRPSYFIFVTNVVLSPRAGGAKDQAMKKLEEAKNRWGLRDYDIWDYDKLRTWLDVDAEVRTTFGWVTAGDVLGTVLHSIEDATTTFERAIVNYLEKTLIADRFVRLEEAGHSAEQPTPLSNVFVDLPVAEEPVSDGLFMRELLERTPILDSHGASREPQADRRVVLVGGPGQGKTTLGQFACQIFRASLLADRPEQSISPEGREAIKAVKAACYAARLPFGRGPRFPLRVTLTDLAKTLSENERPLLAYLAEMISGRVGSAVSSDLFRQWLGAYPWFLVLDGLDEVPASAGRERVMRCVTEFWVDAAQAKADIVVLATTRPQGYNNDLSPDRYEHLELAELSTTQALDYGFRLAAARYGANSDRVDTVKTRLTSAANDETTAHLMRSPLQVAIMTALVDRHGQPPHERWSLFDTYYDVIYQRERERDTDAAAILREYRPDIDAIHQHVGLALQVLTTHEGHSDPRLTSAQLGQIIDARLASEGHKAPEMSAMAGEIRSAAELRLVFLVGAQSDRIGFEIRSLQEFMAAGALVDGPDGQVIRRLAMIAPLPAWRNVMLFAAGKCFVRRQYMRAQLHSLCRELDVNDPLLGAAQAGARLALDLLEDRTAWRQPHHHRVNAEHALDSLSLADPDVALRLARCHHENVDDLYASRLASDIAGADEVRRTNARRCLVALHAAGVRWAQSLLRKHLPASAHEAHDMLSKLPVHMLRSLDEAELRACIELFTYEEFAALDMGPLQSLFPGLPWIRFHDSQSYAMSFSAGRGYELTITPVSASPSHPRYARDIQRGPVIFESPTIAVYRATREFAREPTLEQLRETLKLIANSSTPDVWGPFVGSAPWPLGVLLARASSKEELVQLSETNVLGDYADWVAAEKKWSKDDISLKEALTDHPIAFPIEAAGISVSDSEAGGLPWLKDFFALPEGYETQRAALAAKMLWAMGVTGSHRQERTKISDLISVASATAQRHHAVGLGVFDVRESSIDGGPLVECLPDHVDINFLQSFGADYSLSLERFERDAIEYPSRRSLEVLANALLLLEETPSQIITFAFEEIPADARPAAAFVAFVTGERAIAPRALGRLFGVCYSNRRMRRLLTLQPLQSLPGWSEFLVGIHDSAPQTWESRAALEELINEAISSRETPLIDTATWFDLDLFAPHPLTLTEEIEETSTPTA